MNHPKVCRWIKIYCLDNNLTIGEFMKGLGLRRNAFYNWQAGVKPRRAIVNRLLVLSKGELKQADFE